MFTEAFVRVVPAELEKNTFLVKFMPGGSWVNGMHDPRLRKGVSSVYGNVRGHWRGLIRKLLSLTLMCCVSLEKENC